MLVFLFYASILLRIAGFFSGEEDRFEAATVGTAAPGTSVFTVCGILPVTRYFKGDLAEFWMMFP